MRWPSRVACALSAASLVVLVTSLAGARRSTSEAQAREVVAPDARLARSTIATQRAREDAARRGPESRHGTETRSDALLASTTPLAAPSDTGSISIGRHNTGRLLNGREIRESEHVRLKRPHGDHHGTDELVTLLERSAATVAEQFPGSRLTIGDLSRRRGGRFRPHRSHRSGRDVDVGFYIVDGQGELVYPDRFIDFRPDGTTRTNPDWRFDDARNWALVAAMVAQDEAPVQYMFVANWLKRRLLAHAEQIGAPAEVIERAAAILDQPRRGGRHEDHFHVRVYCALDDLPRCLDTPPYHAWVQRPTPEQMAALRASDAERRADRARARRRGSRAEARAEARRRERRAARRARAAEAAQVASAPAAGEPAEIPGG